MRLIVAGSDHVASNLLLVHSTQATPSSDGTRPGIDTLCVPPAPLAPRSRQGQLAEVTDVTPWDGQDAKEEAVDEFSLDDLMNDEL